MCLKCGKLVKFVDNCGYLCGICGVFRDYLVFYSVDKHGNMCRKSGFLVVLCVSGNLFV